MLGFIDESGDTGFKFSKGSSHYFVIALVLFESSSEAIACDQKIQLLKTELGYLKSEFHFKRNSNKIRSIFLKTILPYKFCYYAIVLHKSKISRLEFGNKKLFYKNAYALLFERAINHLNDTIIVIDKSDNLDFQRELEAYLKRKFNNNKRRIRSLKMQKSSSNNLLQIADYIAGIMNRSITCGGFKNEDLRKMIGQKEIVVEVWPHNENS